MSELISFGKHKGAKWSEVPEKYLEWCTGQTDGRWHLSSESLRDQCARELARRDGVEPEQREPEPVHSGPERLPGENAWMNRSREMQEIDRLRSIVIELQGRVAALEGDPEPYQAAF
jgi:hypothetical protein